MSPIRHHRTPRLRQARATTILWALLAAALCTPALATVPAQSETFRALATHMGTGPVGQVPVQITISRWSTPEERQGLLRVLMEEGADELIDALRDEEETGFIRTGTEIGGRLKYAFEFHDGDRRQVIAAMPQQIAAFMVSGAPVVAGYQFTLVNLQFDENGQGQGTLWLTARLGYDNESNRITIQSLSSEPIRLTNLQVSR